MIFFEILFKGYIILIIAILFNYLMKRWGIKTWYSFLNSFKNPNLKKIDYIFLFLIYPLLLGYLVIILNS